MFADDTKLWTKNTSAEDSISLQKDLDSLQAWSEEWQLHFNPENCKVMHIGHFQDTKYYMKEGDKRVEVQSVTQEEDIGVYFTSDFKPEKQCLKSAVKARSILAMVRWNFKRMDERSFCLLYNTYIRPHLELSVPAWSAYLRKDIRLFRKGTESCYKIGALS